MSRIRSKDTAPEMRVRSALHRAGYRFRLHVKDLPGKPDIVLPKYKTVIFVHGCFWHQHKKCRHVKIPETRRDWWKTKLNNNSKRDKVHQQMLLNSGWNILIVWECFLDTHMYTEEQKKQLFLDTLGNIFSGGESLLELSEKR